MVCRRLTIGRALRTYARDELRLVVCRRCFYELIGNDLAARKSKSELKYEMLDGEQLPLPF